MGAELLPCPMCGCAATFVKHSAGVQGTQGFDKWDAVACKHCRTTVGACDRRFRCREDAAEAWNRRVPQSALESERQAHAAEVERLRVKAERYDWLRDPKRCEALGKEPYVGIEDDDAHPNHWALTGEQADAAIDQAIARGKT